jgi:hypothetical protein
MKRHRVNARRPPKRLCAHRFRLIVRHSDKAGQTQPEIANMGLGADADNLTQPTVFFASGFAVKRLAGVCSQSVLVATVASATVVQSAVWKCDDGSDMTLTVPTSRVNRAGSPIAVVSSAIGAGHRNP